MRGRIFLKHLTDSLKKVGKSDIPKNPDSDSEWTDFMKKVLENIGTNTGCYVTQKHAEKGKDSGEYLGIDALYFNNAEYTLHDKKSTWGPYTFPIAAVELENSFSQDKITYCLWKILCIRAPIQVLICYQPDENKFDTLIKKLESVIWNGSLMKGTNSDLYVIIGNYTKEKFVSWEDYFTVFEWRSDKFSKISDFEW